MNAKRSGVGTWFITSAACSIVCFACTAAAAAVAAPGGPSSKNSSPADPISRIDIAAGSVLKAGRAVGIEDLLSVRELHEPRLSPDGDRIAFIVQQAFRDCDCSRSAVYVAEINSGLQRKLLEADALSGLSWSPDGRWVTYLSSRGGESQLWRVSPQTGVQELLLSHDAKDRAETSIAAPRAKARGSVGIESYSWSPNGNCIAFTSRTVTGPNDRQSKEGFLYDDMNMKFGSDYWQYVGKLFTYCLDTKAETEVWHTSPSGRASIEFPSWSSNDEEIAFAYVQQRTSNSPATGIGVVNVRNHASKTIHRSAAHDFIEALTWRTDGAALFFMNYSELNNNYTFGSIDVSTTQYQEIGKDLIGQVYTYLAWDATRARMLVGLRGIGTRRANAGIYSVGLAAKAEAVTRISPTDSKFADCHDLIDDKIVCVAQSPSNRPKIAILSAATGTTQILEIDVNAELEGLALSPVKELHWTNRFGAETSGYLVIPRVRKPPSGYPLLLMGYGLDGDFVMQASSVLTSYPAQVLAHDGIAVLLVNPPIQGRWQGNDVERGAMAWGLSPLASVEAIIDQLHGSGVIDSSKVGFAGHSWGGFWVEFAITQRPDLFRAAAIVNGGTLATPGSYFQGGNEIIRSIQEHYWGGPPYPPTLKNYIRFSPPLLASRVRAPVLIEAEDREAPFELEMFTALRSGGKPVEFYIYPNDGHSLSKPQHRYYSMRRNLEWFEFWLLDRTANTPIDPEQYVRWRAMAKKSQIAIGRRALAGG